VYSVSAQKTAKHRAKFVHCCKATSQVNGDLQNWKRQSSKTHDPSVVIMLTVSQPYAKPQHENPIVSFRYI